MTAFRILPDPFAVYFDLNGKLAAGGNLHFYAAGTTTDADVYGDEALTVNNGPTIAIGTDGRAVDDIWGDGSLSYRCRIYASDGTLVADKDNLGLPGSGSLTIPSLVAGDFLTSDGSVLVWQAIRQALDPTGASNKIIGSDGTNLVWVDKPADGTNGAAGTNANITLSANQITMNNGTGSLWCVQWGTGSAAASGGINTSTTLAFPTHFASTPSIVLISPTNDATGSGYLPTWSVNNASSTGASIEFGTNGADPGVHFTAAQNFNWIAFGTITS